MYSKTTVTYTPVGPSIEGRSGHFLTTRLMFEELVSSRELIWRLFVRDFSAKYRQSIFGVTWALIMPLITVGMFVGMNRSGILNIIDVGMPYPLYAIIGLTIWNLFTVGATACSTTLVNAGSMVTKINFPKVALVVAATGHCLVELMIRMILIGFAFLYYGITPSLHGVFAAILLLIPLYLLMLGIGFILSLATGVARDIPSVMNIVLMVTMLLTPVLYPIVGDNLLSHINVWNPFNYLINVPRDFIIHGQSEYLVEFCWVILLSVGVFYCGWRLFYLAQTKIAERI